MRIGYAEKKKYPAKPPLKTGRGTLIHQIYYLFSESMSRKSYGNFSNAGSLSPKPGAFLLTTRLGTGIISLQSRVYAVLNQEAGPSPAPDRGRRRQFRTGSLLAAKQEAAIGGYPEKVRPFRREPEDWPKPLPPPRAPGQPLAAGRASPPGCGRAFASIFKKRRYTT